ncbi:MAG TPA: response regulator [Gemmatimonadales bacterium]|nr:response regulator [Gemmatimonadales bacterium]
MTDPEPASRPHLVLIANDQEWSARSLESILAPNGYAVLRAYTGQQALERARAARPDLVILDAQMPDLHGIEVCRTLRQDPRFSATTPILITTAGPSGRTQRLEAYRAGAWEFLGQPLDGESLLLKLETFLAAKLEADRFRADALLDEATGLYNMRGLSRRAREVASEAIRRHQPLVCLALAQDPSGNGASPDGNAEIVRLGQLLREHGRASDVLGRLGDFEFAVIAPATSEAGAHQLVQRLQAAFAQGGETGSTLRVRAGYCAVPDFAAADVDAIEMLVRATAALHYLRAGDRADQVLSFEQVPAA